MAEVKTHCSDFKDDFKDENEDEQTEMYSSDGHCQADRHRYNKNGKGEKRVLISEIMATPCQI